MTRLDTGTNNAVDEIIQTNERIEEAIQIVLERKEATRSLLQREMQIGYVKAGKVLDDLIRLGVIRASENKLKYRILMTVEEYEQSDLYAKLNPSQSSTQQEMPRTMEIPTVSLNEAEGVLEIIDQTLLPNQVRVIKLKKVQDIHRAIYRLEVRGAPAIGVAAAIGLYVSMLAYDFLSLTEFRRLLGKHAAYLETARPTAVNLSWAVQRMMSAANAEVDSVSELLEILHNECVAIWQEDIAMCHDIGEHALSLLRDGCGILTHCNAGQLATSKYGTALSPIHLGAERGMHFRVYADETRPLLQGARLTSFELMQSGVDVTLICDNMASYVMKNGLVDAVLVGCDRIAANGDVCNKIGTSGVAVLAHHYGIPFYVLGPTSTIDASLKSGDLIPIEQRSADEVTDAWYQNRMAPKGVKVLNPAFDVTDHSLVTAIITEKGVLYPPYDRSLLSALQKP